MNPSTTIAPPPAKAGTYLARANTITIHIKPIPKATIEV